MTNRSKPKMLGDILHIESSLCAFITETWLDPKVEDAEVLIPDYTIFRGDRYERQRGGAAIYINDKIRPKKVSDFSNGVVDIVIVKSSIMDAIFICIYRPPDD